MRFRELLEAHKKDMAKIITQEHGKTLTDAEGSITRGIEVVEFAAGIPHLLKGEFSENVGSEVDSWSMRAAGWRLRRHHAFQLPGDGADVDVSGRHRGKIEGRNVSARRPAAAAKSCPRRRRSR